MTGEEGNGGLRARSLYVATTSFGENTLKKLISIFASGLLLFALASTALAAGPRGSLTCFGSPCTSDGTTATFSTGAGVYLTAYNGKSFYSKLTSQVTTLQNNVGGSPLGIDPRWSIPIDSQNDGDTDVWAFVSFQDCNNGAGLVDVIHDSTCTIYRSVIGGATESFANWAAMVAAYPNDRISYADYAFIIADGSGAAGTWTVTNVKVGKNI